MSKKIAIDLGTTNVIVYIPKKGIVINEPNVVALQASDSKIMAIGNEAKEMLGRTPESIVAAHPLQDGVIANFRITKSMIKIFIDRVMGRIRFFRPEVMITVPAGVTSTEKRAVIDATIGAGAKQAYIIKEPIAAALGAGIPIATPSGHMIIDIGGGTSEVAVLSLGDIVSSSSVRVGGMKIDQAISSFIRKKHSLIIGEQTAEDIKIKIGSAIPLKKEMRMEISGSNAVSGLPESLIVSSDDVVKGIKSPMLEIINAVKEVLQNTPPELASDVMDKGIILTGGGAMLRNLDVLFTKITGVPCEVAEEPQLCTAKGCGIALDHLQAFKQSVLWAKS
ncbi:rod shape-determining protein [Candidatus Berkelbacteria bacterium RIFOXYA2_FULL_43_10]|uniref:Cell shape-determining protein MreB n=1 Tax=Candidatus Berkelbacteria bacterium RIFOXYA2_FULL_43_10 TaxID=1797472 RepID=A0A1F5EES9_9BACT|nr:MAG: rod shape-determining protein [Candidatus Berkelbacteria bacterium RIFOXYA2_FULL_43_10]